MAYDLSALRPPGALRFVARALALSSTAGDVVAVTLPAGAVSVDVSFESAAGAAAAGWLAGDGQTDGEPVDGDTAWAVASGDVFAVPLAGSGSERPVLYVARIAADDVVRLGVSW